MSVIQNAIKNFAVSREDPEDYSKVIDAITLHYVRSDEYASLNKTERNKIIDCVLELKALIDSVIQEKKSEESLPEKEK